MIKSLDELFFLIVTRPYKTWSDTKMKDGCGSIASAMNKNPNFPTLTAMIADYQVKVKTFSDLVDDAKFRDMKVVADKNTARTALILATIELGIACEGVANGDLNLLITTALPLRKIPQRIVLPLVSNLEVTNGTNSGELDIKVKGIKGAIYSVCFALYGDTLPKVWITLSSKRCTYTITGLQVGARYWIKVGAVGRDNSKTWSVEIVSPFVQERGNK